ncbi:DUF2486 family protein [Paraburkholderia sp.]|uniref:DUF2486 family protein n=1 Tax=Paraburkholderia sp. TaxID=1926495 RepID=UPI0023899BDC|nr:DUF2486 family protein [Paraburkholderia sp.]MDE1182925.1 DUF2486 family protein [Paraburkholderia sp.]
MPDLSHSSEVIDDAIPVLHDVLVPGNPARARAADVAVRFVPDERDGSTPVRGREPVRTLDWSDEAALAAGAGGLQGASLPEPQLKFGTQRTGPAAPMTPAAPMVPVVGEDPDTSDTLVAPVARSLDAGHPQESDAPFIPVEPSVDESFAERFVEPSIGHTHDPLDERIEPTSIEPNLPRPDADREEDAREPSFGMTEPVEDHAHQVAFEAEPAPASEHVAETLVEPVEDHAHQVAFEAELAPASEHVAEPLVEPVEDHAHPVEAEPEPASEHVGEPFVEPVEEHAHQAAFEHAPEPAAEHVGEPFVEPVEDHAHQAAFEHAPEPAAEHVGEPFVEPVEEHAHQVAAEHAPEPASEHVGEPFTQAAEEPAHQAAFEHAPEPASERVAEPFAQAAQEHAHQAAFGHAPEPASEHVAEPFAHPADDHTHRAAFEHAPEPASGHTFEPVAHSFDAHPYEASLEPVGQHAFEPVAHHQNPWDNRAHPGSEPAFVEQHLQAFGEPAPQPLVEEPPYQPFGEPVIAPVSEQFAEADTHEAATMFERSEQAIPAELGQFANFVEPAPFADAGSQQHASQQHASPHAPIDDAAPTMFERNEPAIPAELAHQVEASPEEIAFHHAPSPAPVPVDGDLLAERLRGRVAAYLSGEGRTLIEARCREALQEHTTWMLSRITLEVTLALGSEMTNWVKAAVEEEVARRTGS